MSLLFWATIYLHYESSSIANGRALQTLKAIYYMYTDAFHDTMPLLTSFFSTGYCSRDIIDCYMLIHLPVK
jgi:hypothetical protein